MIRGLKELMGFQVIGRDGEIGKAEDFFFDDQSWFTRYLVVNTGTWLFERIVIVATPAIEVPDRKNKELPVNLTKAQVEQSPNRAWQRSISRQQELELHQFYNWPPYWTGVGGMFPPPPLPPVIEEVVPAEPIPVTDPTTHFGSVKETLDYSVLATDGEIGHLDDFLADEEKWQIRYAVVHERKLLHGKKFLLPVEVLQEISWVDGAARVNVPQERIKNSPQFDLDASIPLDPEYEARVREYYLAPAHR